MKRDLKETGHEPGSFHTVRTLAKCWTVSSWTVRQRIWRGELRATLIGGSLRISPADVAVFEQANAWSQELCRARTARPKAGRPAGSGKASS